MTKIQDLVILYSSDLLLGSKNVDDAFFEESRISHNLGYDIGIINLDDERIYYDGTMILTEHDFTGKKILYRGWMLNSDEYHTLERLIQRRNGELYTSFEQYSTAHYLPNWVKTLSDHTAQTKFYPNPVNIDYVLKDLPEWNGFFLKDAVKSYYGYHQAHSKMELPHVLDHLVNYEDLQKGLVVREKSYALAQGTTEIRCWWINGEWVIAKHPQHSEISLPNHISSELLDDLNEKFKSLNVDFITVDLYWDSTEEWKIIEIGDGQVSGLGSIADLERILPLL